jgi:exodeoxyribonuclease VII small subunit
VRTRAKGGPGLPRCVGGVYTPRAMARGPEKRSDSAPAASAAVTATAAADEDGAAAKGGELGIDDILGRLERVVKELEGGDLPLERALERFELGVKLARRGSQLLDGIEERVEMLLADRDEVVPLPRPPAARGDDDDGG